jgi:hypothetical protein
MADETVNHPRHYNAHPSGVECIDVVEHMGFNLGNAIKYIWRADEKGNALEDLRKAAWYVQREIEKRQREESHDTCPRCGGDPRPATDGFIAKPSHRPEPLPDPLAHPGRPE